MGHKPGIWVGWACVLGLTGASVARADQYQAAAALEKQDLPRAFTLYRELAELGHAGAQEILAIMYVNGEGVARDNVLGYAWAKLSLESESESRDWAKTIVSQLEPLLNEGIRARVAEVQSQFGRDALLKRILPVENPQPHPVGASRPAERECTMTAAADPANYYPVEAKRQGISGSVLIQVLIQPDGSARNPRVLYSYPVGAFDASGRAVALASHYRAKTENGVRVPCSMVFKVKFRVAGGGADLENETNRKTVSDVKAKALAGDPGSQLAYGVILSMLTEFNKDNESCDAWFLKAAQAGIPPAQYLVGLRLMHDGAYVKDESKGRFWLERAANSGSADAQVVLASYLLRADADAATRNQGFDWMQRAASTKNHEAKFLFASLLASWPDVSRRDPGRALELLREVSISFDYDPAYFEIRAAALAAQGDFAAAKSAQKTAVSRARNLKWETSRQQARLDAYTKGQPGEGELIPF
jgi:TonB family protein